MCHLHYYKNHEIVILPANVAYHVPGNGLGIFNILTKSMLITVQFVCFIKENADAKALQHLLNDEARSLISHSRSQPH